MRKGILTEVMFS